MSKKFVSKEFSVWSLEWERENNGSFFLLFVVLCPLEMHVDIILFLLFVSSCVRGCYQKGLKAFWQGETEKYVPQRELAKSCEKL